MPVWVAGLVFLSGCAAARNNTDRAHVIPDSLEVRALSPDRPSPQAAGMATVRWKAEASGGVGERSYTFWRSDDQEVTAEQKGPSPEWVWTPHASGSHRVKVVVRDSMGNLAQSAWSQGFVVTPRLEIAPLVPDRPAPQVSGMAAVRWKAEASGGVGDRSYEFRFTDGKEETRAQAGPSSSWEWRPERPGVYRVKAIVFDAIGNRAESVWSPGYEVVPPLVLKSLFPDRPSPQAAGMATVGWKAEASGGAGDRIYEFRYTDGKEEMRAQAGPSSSWEWRPGQPGVFRVKAIVSDAVGNRVESDWSAEYVTVPRLEVSPLVPNRTAPQAAEMATVRWSTTVAGGVGNRTFEFWITDGKDKKLAQTGAASSWEWRPERPGIYRVIVVVRDALGNRIESGWSPQYLVVQRLNVSPLVPDRPAPQAADMATVRWKAGVSGGVGDRVVEFHLFDGKGERLVQVGPATEWNWSLREAGTYRVRAVVRDSIGNTAESGWSPEYAVVPKLTAGLLSPGRPEPQAAEMAAIQWTANATGGVGDRTYEFIVSDGKEEKPAQTGPSSSWEWRPDRPGAYRVKAIVSDAVGNRVESGWSPVYKVVSPLVVESLTPDRSAPQTAKRTAILWSVSAKGGVGDRTYEFLVTDGKEEKRAQAGPSSTWEWRPDQSGIYRIKTIVRDVVGNQAASGWSSAYEITKESVYDVQIAVLPVENLSGTAAPLKKIRDSLMDGLKARGFKTLDEKILEDFMASHRMRYTGGIDGATARAFMDRTGTGAVLISSLELYDDSTTPKISLTSRLVSTGNPPIILWMDTVAIAGDDSPGLLDLGLIEDHRVLLKKVPNSLSGSLAEALSGRRHGDLPGGKRNKFQPKVSYKSPSIDHEAPHTLAVLPFLNQSLRKYGGEIMMLHFVREMTKVENVRVVEPGLVRNELLNYRIIMDDGISLSNADIVFGALEADLFLTGKVLDYQDYQGSDGAPVVDFSLIMIERKSREVVWSSKSYNKGTDGVYFFNRGRERTASSMASEMARVVGERMWK